VTTPSGSDRYVVDSSGWVEFLGNGPKADAFAKYLENQETLLLPTIVVYEVYKKMLREQDLALAEKFLSTAFSFQAREIVLDVSLAALAARRACCKPADGGRNDLRDGSGAPGGADHIGRAFFRTSGRHADLVTDWVQFRFAGNSSAAP